MNYKIVADSSSDLLTFSGMPYESVPLKIITKDKEYTDDASLNVEEMVEDLRRQTAPTGTSCPNVHDWITAFGDAEKQLIITKDLKNYKEKNTSDDPVTLLTCDEAKRLFANHADRMCTPTAYTIAQGARESTKFRKDKDGYYNVNWWTRNHSWESNARGSYVANSGGVMTCGGNTEGQAANHKVAVRPAVYFDAQALNQALAQIAAQ